MKIWMWKRTFDMYDWGFSTCHDSVFSPYNPTTNPGEFLPNINICTSLDDKASCVSFDGRLIDTIHGYLVFQYQGLNSDFEFHAAQTPSRSVFLLASHVILGVFLPPFKERRRKPPCRWDFEADNSGGLAIRLTKLWEDLSCCPVEGDQGTWFFNMHLFSQGYLVVQTPNNETFLLSLRWIRWTMHLHMGYVAAWIGWWINIQVDGTICYTPEV